MRSPYPLDFRQRIAHPIRVAGVADDLDLGGTLTAAAQAAGQGIGDAARAAGAGIGEAASGVGDAARTAETGVSNAAGSVSDAASNTGKWVVGLAIGVPLTLGLATLAALAYASRGAAQVAASLGPDALPALLPLLGPEGAAAAALAGAVTQRRPPTNPTNQTGR